LKGVCTEDRGAPSITQGTSEQGNKNTGTVDVQQTRKKKKKRLESRGVSQANWRNISFTNNTDMPYRRTYAYGKKRPAYKKRARKASTAYGTLALNALKGYALAKLKQKLHHAAVDAEGGE